MNETDTRNIAETLADVLPKAQLLTTIDTDGLVPGIAIHHYAVPKGAQVVEMKSDLEHYLANPRKTKATAMFGDHTSFLNYVAKHATEHTVAWYAPRSIRARDVGRVEDVEGQGRQQHGSTPVRRVLAGAR